MQCAKCDDNLQPEDALECALCKDSAHYSCVGMSDRNYLKMSKDRKETWKCLTCKEKKDVTFTIPVNDKDVSKKKDADKDVSKEKDAGKDKDTQKEIRELFNGFTKEIKGELKELTNSVNFTSGQVDDLLMEFRDLKKNFKDLQAKQEELMKENLTLKKTVKDLKSQVLEIEQKSLDHNLEINGIPDNVADNTIIPALCEAINVPVPKVTEYTVKRSATRTTGKPKTIMVQFESKYTRNTILKESKKVKPKVSNLTKNSSDTHPVYVNEQLSPQNKLLFYNAGKIKKDKNYLFLWVSEGHILLKKTADARIVRIRDLEDMN